MDSKEIIQTVSKKLNIPYEVVNKAYSSYWEFIKTTIEKLPLKEDLTEEQFSQLRTNFNVPSLGKLNCTYERMLGIKQKYKYGRDKNGRLQKEIID